MAGEMRPSARTMPTRAPFVLSMQRQDQTPGEDGPREQGQPAKPRRRRLSLQHRLPADPSRLLRRILDRRDATRPGALRAAVSPPHLRDRRRLPSVLRASRLPHQPHLPVLPGLPGADLGAARCSVVGCPPPPAPQILGHGAGCALAGTARLPLFPCRLDLRATQRCDRLCGGARPGPLQRADVARSDALRAAGIARAGDLADCRHAGSGCRLLLEHGRGVARDVQHQFARSRGWPPPLCHRRRVRGTTGCSR